MAQIVSVKGIVDDRLSSAVYLADRLRPLCAAVSAPAIHLDLSRLEYIGPDGITLLAAHILAARARGLEVSVGAPSSPASLVAFLESSGFDEHVLGKILPVDASTTNSTVPLRRFDASKHGDVEPILNLIARFEPATGTFRDAMEIAINEIVQNVQDHAHSPIGGWGSATLFPEDREVRVALVDLGVGIPSSIRKTHPDLASDAAALQAVSTGGFSARSQRHNAGRGIDNLRSIVTELFAGSLYLFSGAASLEIRSGEQPTVRSLPLSLAGTMVAFTLPLDPLA